MAPPETVKRFLNDPDGPKVFGQPQQVPKPQLSPITTIPSKSGLSLKDQPAVSKSASSENSTSPSTSPSSSVLSSRESGSSNTSIAPSEGADSLVGDFETMSIGGHNRRLPCLMYIIGCPISFQLSERDVWHSHNLSHYGDNPPPTHAMCIFCNTSFDSRDPFTCWSNRMNHIAEHFEMYKTIEQSRPDFHVIKDMWKKGCISEEDYKLCIEYTERPPCDGLRPSNYIPEEIEKKQKAAYDRVNRVPIRESRQEVRDRQRGKGPSVVGPKKSRSKAIVK